MKKIFNFSIVLALFTIALCGCKKETSNNEEKPTGNMQTAVVKGIATDADDQPMSGVTVTTGSLSAITDDKGEFSFKQVEVINGRAIVRFERYGYYSLTRSSFKADALYFKAVLTPKGNSDNSLRNSFNSKEGATLSVGGAKVVLPPNAIRYEDGDDYTGTVHADMLYLDPTHENYFFMKPGGDGFGLDKNGKDVFMISYGVVIVELADIAGNPLQVKSETPATLTCPAPKDVTSLPATIPISTFNESKGVWIEEGVATLIEGKYVSKGFKQWEHAEPSSELVFVKGEIKDCKGNHPDVEVWYTFKLNGKLVVSSAVTAASGFWANIIPKGVTVELYVSAGGKQITESFVCSGDDNFSAPQQVAPQINVPCSEVGTLTIENGASYTYNYAVYNPLQGVAISICNRVGDGKTEPPGALFAFLKVSNDKIAGTHSVANGDFYGGFYTANKADDSFIIDGTAVIEKWGGDYKDEYKIRITGTLGFSRDEPDVKPYGFTFEYYGKIDFLY
ncbi:MAG: carboxypeptidase-like regulatory domain-containing protein [Bacteroidales bacterium]|jgi:hypothetical protein|nr:carboxypeptidase-like regulatory domain-containing protein [Bacteroidales bacterium]